MIDEAEQIVYHFMHYGWLSKEHQSVSLPPSNTRESKSKEGRVGQGTGGPLPQPLPPSNRQSSSEEPEPTADPALPRLQMWKPACETMRSQSISREAMEHKICLWFDRTPPIGLSCGSEPIILATRIPALQSVTVGTKLQQNPTA